MLYARACMEGGGLWGLMPPLFFFLSIKIKKEEEKNAK